VTKARVLLCTSGGICATLSLQALLNMDEVDIVGLFISTRTRTKNGSFIGDAIRIAKTSGLSYACYLAHGTTLFDCLRLPGTLPTINHLAKQHHIPTYRSGDINSKAAQAWLETQAPDILLSSFFNLKLSAKTLAIPRRIAVNLHPALLPAYKGVDPVFYYFLNEEKTLGISLHQMAEDFDTGSILAQTTMDVIPSRSVFWHNTELFRLGLRLFQKWMKKPSTELNLANTEVSDQYDSWPSSAQTDKLQQPLWQLSDLWEQARRPL
jgi:methionyl-tRNA formyltransferase